MLCVGKSQMSQLDSKKNLHVAVIPTNKNMLPMENKIQMPPTFNDNLLVGGWTNPFEKY